MSEFYILNKTTNQHVLVDERTCDLLEDLEINTFRNFNKMKILSCGLM